MEERHNREQYFFDQGTADAVANLLERFEHPCLLCAPSVGVELEERGVEVSTLDIDKRFTALRGYRFWDIARPTPLDATFDVIFCDPPFFSYSLSQLFQAIRMLARFDFTQRLIVSYLVRRREAVLATFAPFGLKATDVRLRYRTVKPGAKNDIALFANFDLRGSDDHQH
jgi:hypothetical protein